MLPKIKFRELLLDSSPCTLSVYSSLDSFIENFLTYTHTYTHEDIVFARISPSCRHCLRTC